MAIEIPGYTVEDFGELLYPLFDLPEGETIMDRFGDRELDYPQFKVPLGAFGFLPGDKDRVIKWIACCYDQGSPFAKDYVDMNQRKTAAALYVGFPIDEHRRFAKHIEEMIMGESQPVVDMIVRYCRNYNSPDYSFLVAIYDDYYRILRDIQGGSEYNFDTIKKMREEIKKLSHEFVTRDTSELLKRKLYKEIEQDSLKLRPEDIATNLLHGVPAITDQEIQDYKSPGIIDVQST